MTVFANGRSILHKGHGKTQLATAPDVCKTPSPGGPVPIPYPNMSPDSNLTQGAATVTINGNPVGNTDAQLSRSNGDEAGTAGGVVSSKNMGAFGWSAGSMDVEAEGKGVVRLLDPLLTNGNTYNDAGITIGEPQVIYGNDQKCPRPNCKLDYDIAKHGVSNEDPDVVKLCQQLAKEVESWGNGRRGPWGRMIGVAKCKHGGVYKAVSGQGYEHEKDIKNLQNELLGGAGILHNAVKVPEGDAFMSAVVAANPSWQCAAVKILTNASGHQIIALLEKWVGNKKGEARVKKYLGGTTTAVFPLGGRRKLVRLMRDHVEGTEGKHNEIDSGGSVPSCGRCQAFLPALICEMKPC
jgi:hypothetical protein